MVLKPQPSTLNPQPSTLNPQTSNPQPSNLNPPPSTLNPQPSTLNPQSSILFDHLDDTGSCPTSGGKFSRRLETTRHMVVNNVFNIVNIVQNIVNIISNMSKPDRLKNSVSARFVSYVGREILGETVGTLHADNAFFAGTCLHQHIDWIRIFRN